MAAIRTLIVDDEAPARARVRRFLSAEKDIAVVGEAANGEEAIRVICELRPQLLFLDVQMPPPDGIAVLRAVRDEWLPCTVFTTAHAAHAVEAFELHAIDYLLKPYTQDRFTAALNRIRKQLVSADTTGHDARVAGLVDEAAAAAGPAERFLVREGERYRVVRTIDVDSVEAAANYVVLHARDGNHILRRTLSAMEADLDPREFFRVNRSCLVRLSCIREVQALAAGEHVVFLHSGAKFSLTRGLRDLQAKLRTAK